MLCFESFCCSPRLNVGSAARGATLSRASRAECPAAASEGDTYAPMLRMAEEVPPGAPTVDSAGPALPALLTNTTLCLYTTCGQQQTLCW